MAMRLITSHIVDSRNCESLKNGVIPSEKKYYGHFSIAMYRGTAYGLSSAPGTSGSWGKPFLAKNNYWQSEFYRQRNARNGQAKAAPSDGAASPLKLQDKVSIQKLSEELSVASPLEILNHALSMFGKDIAIAFSGAEDVALIEYAQLTGRPFRVFSLDTGRLNPETYRFFAEVEKHYDIQIEYTFPDASEVEALVRQKGLFSFYEDGHQECCSIRKVRPLKKMLKGLKAWITGQRHDQSPGTRANVPVIQLDPSFEGIEGGIGSLVKWNPLANVSGADIWNFLRTMDVPVNTLHSQGYVSIGCEPCTRPVLPGQHEREGRWWWEDATAKECGLHKGNLTNIDSVSTSNVVGDQAEEVDLFTNKNINAFSQADIEKLNALDKRDKSGIVVLYAPWCPFCQAMGSAYNEVADQLEGSDVFVGKFRADGDNKVYSQSELQLKSFPTILFFPKSTKKAIKYPSERRDVGSLLAFVRALK
ncbi:hypothetical protein O6H91_19G040900 [Diphasiastrum complanatum]|uniref:Uncharacterized protein n=1 Tax=Diphasiastrum complanatum TaxID=34168 RepID=A0ACC2AUM5_DIPCM|nr:hypothetical protein O6H91_19G040900 [Diphasiastrum complanatum]